MRALALSLLLLPLPAQAPTPTPTPTPPQPPLAERLQAELVHRLGNTAPGAMAAVVLADGTLIPFAAGVADRDRKTPMAHDGMLLAGSTGKTFFAALACQLIHEKRLDLDARVATWFADDAWFARLPNAADLTIRQLLMHRSGLMRYEFDPEFTKQLLAAPDHRWTPQEELAFVLDKEPRFGAGAGFEYSDTNYVLLGLVLERITGKPCQDEIARRFLRPLGLAHTVAASGRRMPGLLPSYAGADNPFGGRDAMLDGGELPFDPAFEGAGGGYATTASDLARWAKALYEGDVLQGIREQVTTGEPAPLGKQTRYGLGCIIDQTPLGPAWGHRGFFPGSLSEMRYYPELKIAVAVLVNSSADRRLPRLLPEWANELARLAAGR